MTALELNAELFRQLSIIAEDETLMRKAVEAIRRLAQQKEAQTEETEYISKKEVLEGIAVSYTHLTLPTMSCV